MTEYKFRYNGESAEKFFPIMAGVIQDDILWIGTYGGGVIRYDMKTLAQKNYRIKEGMSNEYILEILIDNSGDLWFSTNKGINRLDPKTDVFEIFRSHDNTVSEEFNAGAALYLENGIMIFGGTRGLTAFYPPELKSNNKVPPVMITGYSVHSDNQKGASVIPQDSVIILNYDDNLFSVSFTALNFINPELNQYAYKLEGFDDQWISNGNRREVFFSNLDPGEYTLRIAAANNDGLWNRQGAAVKIIVNPPWWGTLWFRIVLAVSIVAFLWFLYNERIKSIRRVEKARADEQIKSMQMLEEAREAESKKREELEQNLKSEIARDLHDDVISELSVITNKCSQILADESIEEKNQKHLRIIKDVSESVKIMIRDVIWFLQFENESNERMIGKFYSTAGNILQDIDYEPEIQKDVFEHPDITVYIKKQIYLIFKESLENIVKHSQADKVVFSLIKKDNQIIMTITDNGSGFDLNNHKPGNGLHNLRKRAAHLYAQLAVDSAPGKGTMIKLNLNLSDRNRK
ncbi:MAG: hypothetical protein L6Q59_13525 [Ignavibacteriaceae bacterium]|nr:hypothetical protein [Ignavibacteriaceae bacterium]